MGNPRTRNLYLDMNPSINLGKHPVVNASPSLTDAKHRGRAKLFTQDELKVTGTIHEGHRSSSDETTSIRENG
jgi:hypothetical protein